MAAKAALPATKARRVRFYIDSLLCNGMGREPTPRRSVRLAPAIEGQKRRETRQPASTHITPSRRPTPGRRRPANPARQPCIVKVSPVVVSPRARRAGFYPRFRSEPVVARYGTPTEFPAMASARPPRVPPSCPENPAMGTPRPRTRCPALLWTAPKRCRKRRAAAHASARRLGLRFRGLLARPFAGP